MKVFNKRYAHWLKASTYKDAVYVGRPTKWGNPFVIGKDGSREEVIEKYKQAALADPAYCEAARLELAGKDLVCWCAPHACHADVLLQIANGEL